MMTRPTISWPRAFLLRPRARLWLADGSVHHAGDHGPCALIAPELLEAEIALPAATPRRALPGLVAAEIGRVTPFRAEDVHWRIRATRRAGDRLLASVALAPRDALLPLAAEAAARDWDIVSIHAEGADPVADNLLPPRPAPLLGRDWLLLGAATGMLLAALIIPQQRLDRALFLAQAAPPTPSALAHARRLMALNRAQSLTLWLETLTHALPDSAWIDRLDFDAEANRLGLELHAPDISGLAQSLAALPGISRAAPEGAITRAEGLEQARLVLELAP